MFTSACGFLRGAAAAGKTHVAPAQSLPCPCPTPQRTAPPRHTPPANLISFSVFRSFKSIGLLQRPLYTAYGAQLLLSFVSSFTSIYNSSYTLSTHLAFFFFFSFVSFIPFRPYPFPSQSSTPHCFLFVYFPDPHVILSCPSSFFSLAAFS